MFILERITEWIAPFSCMQCGGEGDLVCRVCLGSFCLPMQPRCYRCLRPSENFAVCLPCSAKSPLRNVWIASRMEGLPEQLVHTFKFERAQAAAPQLAILMDRVLPHLTPDTLIVPIPTATSRIRQRGYDHTALIALSLARKRKYQYQKLLVRNGQSRQVGAARKQRFDQLRDAFRTKQLVAHQHILLVDDVVTTGATLEEAGRVLRAAGAKRIDGVVFAQKG